MSAGAAPEEGRTPVRLLYGLAFVSGFAALVYQVAWSSLLSLSFGSSTLAVSAVVAGFMGGMGVGAWRYHRVSRRVQVPLRGYALLEVGIAATTAVFTLLFGRLPGVLAWVAGVVPPGVGFDLVRVVGAVVVLMLPAALMGATYPALCLALIRSRGDVDRHLGGIYGLNTVGAALGAAVAGLLWMEWLGAHGSVLAANLLNLGVGAAAWGASRRAPARPAAPAAEAEDRIPTALPHAVTGLVLFGSGLATLGYEIVWFRALRYLVGNSSYALGTVLVVFLLGLGLGGLLYRPVLRRMRAEHALVGGQLGVAVLALLAIGAEQYVLLDAGLRDHFSIFSVVMTARPWWERLATSSGLAVAIMLPATLGMGLTFPLASRLFLGSVSRLGNRVGVAYLLSNLGSIVGAVGAAVWILPTLGTVDGTRALACLNLALGGVVLAFAPARRRLVPTAVAAVAAVAALLVVLPDRMAFVGEPGVMRLAPRLVFEEEGELGTVQVRLDPRHPDHRLMLIDGVAIAATGGIGADLEYKQRVLAHLPRVMDRRLVRTLNVGIASCSTLEALARHDDVEVLDAVEINPGVMHGARLFSQCEVLKDPRVHVVVEDAVHFLLRSPAHYDLIVSDGKQNRDFSGNAKILSLEFYRYALQSLTPCGIFVQWIPLSNAPKSFEMILRTFREAFPEVEIFFGPPGSVFMAGSRCSMADRPRMGAEAFAAAGIGEDLASHGVTGPEDLLGLWIASGAHVDAALPPGRLNDWDRMPVAYESYRSSAGIERNAAANLALLLRGRDRVAAETPFERLAVDEEGGSRRLQDAYLASLQGDPSRATQIARRALADHPDDPVIRRALDHFLAQQLSAR